MKFRYSARTKSGEMQVGNVEAVNREAATGILSQHDLYILSLDSYAPPKWYESVFLSLWRVRRKDLAIFTRQFATMLDAKIAINDALSALYNETTNPFLKEALYEVSTDITSGLSLSQALQKHSDIFFDFYTNLVQSAEVTGRVDEVMGYLAEYLEKEMLLVSKVRTALIYPAFVVSLAIVVGGILIGLVFPQIAPLFEDASFQLPLITRVFLLVGDFINNWWLVIVIFAIAFIFIIIDYVRTKEGKSVLDQIILAMPVVRGFFKKLYVARFSEVASVLIKGGIPITQALEISGHTSGSSLYQEILHEVVEKVRRGELLSQALGGYRKYFPPIVTQMVVIGEQTGRIDEMFIRISSFYSREVENVVGNLTELVQPIVMVGLGVVVGLMFAALLLPIYNLIQVIR